MTIEEAAAQVHNELYRKYKPGTFTVGHDQRSTIFIYEHKRRTKYNGPDEIGFFRIVRKFVGKVMPAMK